MKFRWNLNPLSPNDLVSFLMVILLGELFVSFICNFVQRQAIQTVEVGVLFVLFFFLFAIYMADRKKQQHQARIEKKVLDLDMEEGGNTDLMLTKVFGKVGEKCK